MRFRFELAERLGMTVAELSRRMTVAELGGWIALWEIRAREADDQRRRAGLRR